MVKSKPQRIRTILSEFKRMNKWKAQEKLWKRKNALPNGKESSPAEVSVCTDGGGDGTEGRPEPACLDTEFRSLSLTLEVRGGHRRPVNTTAVCGPVGQRTMDKSLKKNRSVPAKSKC